MAKKITESEASAGMRLPTMGAAFSVGPPSRAYRTPMSEHAGAGAVIPSQWTDVDESENATDEDADVAADDHDGLTGDSGHDDGDGDASAGDDGSEDET
jgi:hypothetical protein